MSQMGETIQTGDNEAREGFASRTSIFHVLLSFLYSIVLLLRLHVVRKSGLRSPQEAVIHIVRLDVQYSNRVMTIIFSRLTRRL